MNDEEKTEESAPLTPTGENDAAAKAVDPEQMKRYVKMPARFSDTCTGCGGAIRVGEPMVWDTTDKRTYCAECGLEHMEAQGVDEEDD